jgi:transitional endoplasmic reticulum ATPase
LRDSHDCRDDRRQSIATLVGEDSNDDASRFVTGSVPEVRFDDIGGQDHAKRQLREYIEYPQRFPEFFEGEALSQSRGILLYGPPGNGKTMLAKAVATETDRQFFDVAGPELESKWVGETEAQIRELFDEAREAAPSVVFIDELDSMAPKRGGCGHHPVKADMVNTLLAELDGLDTGDDVVVIGSTNRKDALDPAILRPGRFDRHVQVPRPDREAYADIVSVHTDGLPLARDVTPEWIASQLPDGCSGAEIAGSCREMAYESMRATLNRSSEIDGDESKIGRSTVKEVLQRE